MRKAKPVGPDRQVALFSRPDVSADAPTEEVPRPKKPEENEGNSWREFSKELESFSQAINIFFESESSIPADVWAARRPEPQKLLAVAQQRLGSTNDLVRELREAVKALNPANIRDAAQRVLEELQKQEALK